MKISEYSIKRYRDFLFVFFFRYFTSACIVSSPLKKTMEIKNRSYDNTLNTLSMKFRKAPSVELVQMFVQACENDNVQSLEMITNVMFERALAYESSPDDITDVRFYPLVFTPFQAIDVETAYIGFVEYELLATILEMLFFQVYTTNVLEFWFSTSISFLSDGIIRMIENQPTKHDLIQRILMLKSSSRESRETKLRILFDMDFIPSNDLHYTTTPDNTTVRTVRTTNTEAIQNTAQVVYKNKSVRPRIQNIQDIQAFSRINNSPQARVDYYRRFLDARARTENNKKRTFQSVMRKWKRQPDFRPADAVIRARKWYAYMHEQGEILEGYMFEHFLDDRTSLYILRRMFVALLDLFGDEHLQYTEPERFVVVIAKKNDRNLTEWLFDELLQCESVYDPHFLILTFTLLDQCIQKKESNPVAFQVAMSTSGGGETEDPITGRMGVSRLAPQETEDRKRSYALAKREAENNTRLMTTLEHFLFVALSNEMTEVAYVLFRLGVLPTDNVLKKWIRYVDDFQMCLLLVWFCPSAWSILKETNDDFVQQIQQYDPEMAEQIGKWSELHQITFEMCLNLQRAEEEQEENEEYQTRQQWLRAQLTDIVQHITKLPYFLEESNIVRQIAEQGRTSDQESDVGSDGFFANELSRLQIQIVPQQILSETTLMSYKKQCMPDGALLCLQDEMIQEAVQNILDRQRISRHVSDPELLQPRL